MPRSESQSRTQQLIRGMAIAGAGWLLLSGLHVAGVFEALDLRLLDWRFRLRGERPASEAIALVGVDDATINSYGAWPLPRDSYALLLTALEEAGARAVGMDLQFPQDGNQDPQWNRLLAHVTSGQPNLVHAIWFHAPGSATNVQPPSPGAGEVLRAQGLPASRVPAPQAASVAVPFPELLGAARRLGHISVLVDRDGAIRSIPMLIHFQDHLYPSLALGAYAAYGGHGTVRAVEWSPRAALVRWADGDRTRLPLRSDGATGIDFAGDVAAFPHTYSMLQLLQWHQERRMERLREAVAGRIVLVALTARAEAPEDIGTTPFAAATPLVYVHANALDNLLRGRFLSRPPTWLHLLVLAGISVVLGWGFSVLSIPRAALLAVFAVAALAGLTVALLAGFAIDAPPSAALALAPLVYAGIGSHRYIFLERSAREREADIRQGRSVQQRFLPEALIGQKLSHYEIVEKLGVGGMGEVYRGRDQRLPRDVAVKVLSGGALADATTRRRFRREALAFSKLNHRHIVTIFEFDSQDGADFIVMEYVAGTSLAKLLERGPLPESQALMLGIQVAEALVEAHARNVLHRDMKPANIMVSAQGEAKVLDFGIAKLIGQAPSTSARSLTETGEMVGTPAYMAPEVLVGGKADARTDLYGLGMVLFEMTTGCRPFPDDQPHELMYLILNQSPPEPRVLNARISPAVQAIILKALEKAPDRRFANAAEMLAALREAAATASGTNTRVAARD